MILVTGATGTVGRHVAGRLAGLHALRVLSRSGARPRPAPSGTPVEVARGDFADRGSLEAAMTGVRAVLLVTTDPLRPEHDANLLAAARAAGVRHLVKLSALAVADPEAEDLVTRWQREAEERIRASGIAWTFLRPRAYMSNTLGWAGSLRREGVVRTPHPGSPNATVDPRDVAEAACRVLTEPGHENRVHALTGPEPLTPCRQVEILSELHGRPLRCEELSPHEHRRHLLARYPAAVADALCESAERQRRAAKAHTTNGVRRLLGRPAGTYRRWAEEHAGAMGLRPGGQPALTASTTDA